MFNSIKEIFEKLKYEDFIKYKIGIRWKDIVGSFLCKNTSPAYIRKETLYIYTFSSVWLHHLSLLKKQILDEIQKVIGLKVENIKFLLIKKEKSIRVIEDQHTEIVYDISDIILLKEKQELIEKISQRINDIDIKKKFSKLLEIAIKRNEFFTKKYIFLRETGVEI